MAVINNVVRNLKSFLSFNLSALHDYHEKQMLAAGKILVNQLASMTNPSLRDVEFSIFSQWGDDGIVQYLVRQVKTVNSTFIEFGVENYIESNTRFLMMNGNWRGLILDGSRENMEAVRRKPWFWRYDLTAVATFITRDNINETFRAHGFDGPIGLLSIDLDGNDYWVWEAITSIDPDIVIVEYNSAFGPDVAVTIPYQESFVRSVTGSNLYWGCSLGALVALGSRKGYSFVGTNLNGNNAYFVRREKAAGLPHPTVGEAFVEKRFRETKNEKGEFVKATPQVVLSEIGNFDVFDLSTGQLRKWRELC